MSWGLFKQNIKRRWDRPDTIEDIDTVAKLWANEYDAAIKRGKDATNFVTLQNGNKDALETFFKLGLQIGLTTSSPSFQLINEFGKGVITYWTGATLNPFPIPLIPATGAIQNIAVITNLVTLPGTWSPIPPILLNVMAYLQSRSSTPCYLKSLTANALTVCLLPTWDSWGECSGLQRASTDGMSA